MKNIVWQNIGEKSYGLLLLSSGSMSSGRYSNPEFLTALKFHNCMLYWISAEKILAHLASTFATKYIESYLLRVDGRAEILDRNIIALESYLSQMAGKYIEQNTPTWSEILSCIYPLTIISNLFCSAIDIARASIKYQGIGCEKRWQQALFSKIESHRMQGGKIHFHW